MAKRTELPRIDIAAMIPAIAPLAKTAIRLHPSPCEDVALDVSKIGGRFLWPHDEPWPKCPNPHHKYARRQPILAEVVQLRAGDFPEVPFRPGSDLFQLLWCPVTEDACEELMLPQPFAYWRNTAEITAVLQDSEEIDLESIIDTMLLFTRCIPRACAVFPERVVEYPVVSELPREMQDLVDWDLYQEEDVGPCPATKIGGHPYWIQDDYTPTCQCGSKMEFLLQLPDWEYSNIDTRQRWIPLEDRWAVDAYNADHWNEAARAILRPMDFDFHNFTTYLFVCRSCPQWPVKLVEQR
jgi:hypothetical protein